MVSAFLGLICLGVITVYLISILHGWTIDSANRRANKRINEINVECAELDAQDRIDVAENQLQHRKDMKGS